LPEKKVIGNTKDDFVAERCYLLDKFLKQITRCPYLFDSEEFKVFLHPEQEIEAQLKYLVGSQTLSPGRLLKRYRKYFSLTGSYAER
jgi:hypothetical protein